MVTLGLMGVKKDMQKVRQLDIINIKMCMTFDPAISTEILLLVVYPSETLA